MPRALGPILRRIEAMNVDGAERYWALMPEALARRLRPCVIRVGDGLLTALPASDSLRMNRVIGLGHRGAAKEAMVDEIIAHYRSLRRSRFSVLLGPGPQLRAITRWLLERGFEPHGGLTLLLRDCRKPVPRPASVLRVARARREEAAAIVRILERCFGGAASRRAWMRALANARDYAHYLAFAGRTPVAVGALRVADEVAWLGGGATLTPWRRRGAHSALICARLSRAAQRGCRHAWVETVTPRPGRPDGSRRNLLRLGFEEVCRKPIFLWRER